MKHSLLAILAALAILTAGCRSFQVDARLLPPAELTATAHDGGVEATGPTVDVVVQRWAGAFDAIHTLRGSQSFAILGPDGARRPVTGLVTLDPRGALKGTDEVYQRQGDTWRYRFVGHFAVGDEITTWDGTTATRYRPWLGEVYHPLPASYAAGAYWVDDIDDLSLVAALAPVRQDGKLAPAYDLVGNSHDPDGRAVIELQVKPGWHTLPFGVEGTRIYLDAATYLPRRIVSPAPPASRDQSSYERTITTLQTNAVLDDSAFTVNPPAGTVTVFEQAHNAPWIQTFGSFPEAANQAGFSLYDRPGQQPRQIYTMYLVEKDGKRSPVIAAQYADGITLVEGLYLPKYGRAALDANQVGQPAMVDLGGQPAMLRTGRFGQDAVTFEKGGTWIELSGNLGDKNHAIELAKDLEGVR